MLVEAIGTYRGFQRDDGEWEPPRDEIWWAVLGIDLPDAPGATNLTPGQPTFYQVRDLRLELQDELGRVVLRGETSAGAAFWLIDLSAEHPEPQELH